MPGKGMNAEEIQLLKDIEQTGLMIAICSGKTVYYLCGFMRQIGLKSPFLLGENGAVIQFGVDLPPGKYFVHPYSKEAGETIRLLEKAMKDRLPHLYFQPNQVELSPFPKNEEDFDIIQGVIDEYTERGLVQDVTIYRYFDAYDIVPANITKRTGLSHLSELTGIPAEQMIAVGDGANDYPMFEYAGCSVGVRIEGDDAPRLTHRVGSTIEALQKVLELSSN